MSRWHYFFKRVLLSIPVLFLVMTLIFVILRLGPLDPVASLLGPEASGAQAEQIRESLGLNEPLWQQYLDFMWGLITLDLGQSWAVYSGRNVIDLVYIFAPRTIWLGFWAVLLPLFIGIPLGFYAGLNPNSWGDYVASFGGIVWLAMPNFWLAIMVLAVLRQTQGGGFLGFDWYTFGPEVNSLIGTPPLDFAGATDWTTLWLLSVPTGGFYFDFGTLAVAIKVILPAAIVLGSASMATELRIGRTAILETKNSNYVETAKAKGLSGRVIVWKHVFRNALIPLVPIITNEALLLLGGSVIVEVIFGINGLGRLFFLAAVQGDLPLAGSLIFIFTLITISLNIIQDLLYTLLDPRVGYD
ncbi:ABC transporter permease [Halobacteria archaeon AArc-m2/3/4]|uniref:ABC transporter permease n=1 Tax=Natronoglomus mannanivorans TaxID=2979990 RepID=A0AAP2Z1I4_9EURY|nr:ABC transporter permease [Halobacteria archaeon AArc-xg1-1]MCU4972259.1 ABC transporter permease [Halobacteria archaeon AArc-m2/3/4]